MELGVLLAALIVMTLAIRSAIRSARIPATAADWYIVFDIDSEKKVLALWFYPVVAFELKDNQTLVVTSRPDVTKKLAATRPAKMVSHEIGGVSVSYGRWFRDGVPFDETGSPDVQDSSDFSAVVESHILGEFSIYAATPVPVFYQNQIKNAVEQAKREA